MMRRIKGGCWLYAFLSIFLLVGFGLMIWGAQILKNASASSDWSATQGEIISAFVRESQDEDGVTYHADVNYSYAVDDRRYQADTVNFGQYGSSSKARAEEIISRYPVGERVNVYYDPETPETAVLEPGVTWSSYLVLGMGFLFALIPSIILIFNIARP